MAGEQIEIVPVMNKGEQEAFMACAYALNGKDPNWVAPLRADMRELLSPGRNPFFEHARMQLFLARRGARVVGRISAHIDELALGQPPEQGLGPGTGNFGLFEAADEEVASGLLAAAEGWLREQGMRRVLGPISLSIWDEPGLLVQGHDHPPMIMMGHHNPAYQGWIEGRGYALAKRLLTYDLPVDVPFPPLVGRIVAQGERNPAIVIRDVDKSRFDAEAEIIIAILNDAWSGNWGFVPFTEAEKDYAKKKLRPIVLDGANKIAELEGEPVAFMLALPDVNQLLRRMNGRLLPFNWARLLWWLRHPAPCDFRVPLMGVVQRLQNSRMASQLAFMMIEYIRRTGAARYGGKRAEVGWVLEDNQGMLAIARAIGSRNNRAYHIYQKPL